MSVFTYGYNDRTKISVNEMSYDEFCIAAFGKDSEELREEKLNKNKNNYGYISTESFDNITETTIITP